MEGYPKRKRGDPTWSAARDDAYAQKERPGGEPYQLSPSGDSATPLGDYKLALNKILLPTFHHRKVTPAGQAYSLCLCTRPRRQAPTNPPLIRTTNPSCCFPIKPTVYTILAQYLPKM